MVASVSALGSAAQASNYYEADDYYSEGGLSPSSWGGKGADDLGLSGEVDRDAFKALLEGQIGDAQLGTVREGKLQHRPGWDVTLSAPKSVSVMAIVAGDRRLLGAHDKAVRTTLAHIENHMAATRIREGGEAKRHSTDNLLIASFRHETSRARDPQLHSHNVILNATKDQSGEWRSLEPRALYQLQKQIGAIYRHELADQARQLGYNIASTKDGLFELADVPASVLNAFSKRSSAIEAALAQKGLTRDQASEAQKELAALQTRDTKEQGDRKALMQDWRATADQAGFDQKERLALISRAENGAGKEREIDPAQSADQAIAYSAQKLGERQSVFASHLLTEEAAKVSMGKLGHGDLVSAISRARDDGELADRQYADRRGASFAGFTTREAIAQEKEMLRLEGAGRGKLAPLLSPVKAAAFTEGLARADEQESFGWSKEQRSANVDILSSRNRVTALQGYAGTAKTTTILASLAKAAKQEGFNVSALAPTASAAQVLGKALDTRADTLARHLIAPEKQSLSRGSLWIVDEASLISTRDMVRLLAMADKKDARLVLVGDVKQLGSVEAGAAFSQLQSAGMTTAKLSHIVRQTNAQTKEAVMASIEGHARRALKALEQGGGQIIEGETLDDRLSRIADRYAALAASDRAKTLVIEPSRDGRDALTGLIRDALVKSGELSGKSIVIESLEAKGLTRAESRQASSYEPGDIIRFTRDYPLKGIDRAQAYGVSGVDPESNRITLEARNGTDIVWHPKAWGAGKSEAFVSKPMEMREGDKVQFTRNDRALKRVNGLAGEIVRIDDKRQLATIQRADGRRERLSLSNPADRHVRHNYVSTTFAAQGRTADRVLVHADSRSTNLVDQKMLYVSLSRAKSDAVIVTDDQARLTRALYERAGEKQTALDAGTTQKEASKNMGAGLG